MGPRELARWQWDGYSLYHGNRANLVIHILLVPAFLAGNVALLCGLALLSPMISTGGLAAMALSFGAQGIGHGRERNPSIPFSGPANAFARIFLEQWFTFPRFVLSGGWLRAFRSQSPNR